MFILHVEGAGFIPEDESDLFTNYPDEAKLFDTKDEAENWLQDAEIYDKCYLINVDRLIPIQVSEG